MVRMTYLVSYPIPDQLLESNAGKSPLPDGRDTL